MILFQILLGMGAGLLIPYFNLYFVQHLGASSALFGLIDGCANALNALLTLLAPLLALRTSRINILVFTRLLSLPIMLIIGLTGWLPLAAALYPIRQGLMDMSAGILQVFSMEVVGEQHRGMANSSYQAAYQAANGLATPIGGLIITHLGYTPVFILAAILYMAALALLWKRFGNHESLAHPL
jgi:predicted MFS family arabinose efflux permease